MELLVRLKSNNHLVGIDDEKDRRGCYKRGMPVVVVEDGQVWGSEEGLPNFGLIKCAEVTVAQATPYVAPWEQKAVYTVDSANNASGTYQLTVSNSDIDQSGNAGFARVGVENWLNEWGATVDSAAPNAITFTVKLLDVLTSDGFWNRDVSAVNFTLQSYTNPTAIMEMDYSALAIGMDANSKAQLAKGVAARISEEDGVLISNTLEIATFSITRQDIIAQFQSAIKQAVDRTWKRRQFYFTEAQCAAIEAAGGTITVTQAQLVAAVKNALND